MYDGFAKITQSNKINIASQIISQIIFTHFLFVDLCRVSKIKNPTAE